MFLFCFVYIRKNNKFFYLVIIVIAFLIFFLRPQFVQQVKIKIVKATLWPVRIMTYPVKELKKLIFYHRTYDEYLELKKNVNVLRARMIGMEEVTRENARLSKLLEFKRNLIYSSVAATVVGRDPSRWNSSIIIDKGVVDGVKIGFPVVNALGVVGKVAEVNHRYSKVMLLTDPQFSVAARSQRQRQSVLISGTLEGHCRVRFADQDLDFEIGDKIVTSKFSYAFPENLLIGEVTEIRKASEGIPAEVVVKPSVSLSQLEEVLVVIKE